MKKYCSCIIMFVLAQTGVAFAQNVAPVIAWQKTLGGNNEEVLTAMTISPDKSIVLCGYSNSGVSGDKSIASYGSNDYWIVKLDTAGNLLWNKTYGGNNDDVASAIICTADGGYLVGGSSISDKSGIKTFKSFEFSYDYWVLKLDADGNVQWDRTLGGTYTEQLGGLAQLPNGTYVVGGHSYSNSNGTKRSRNSGSETNAEYWIVLLNSDGTEKSQYQFNANGQDVVTCVSPHGTSGFYVGGYSYSMAGGNKIAKSFGNNDLWIVRSNLKGKIEFQADLGGKLSDYLSSMQALPDSSLILGSTSNSYKYNTKSERCYGIVDMWLLKLKQDGTKQWDKTIAGGAGDGFGADYLVSVQQTKDKGFIVGGYSNSGIGRNKTENSKGNYDYWIVKTDSLGNVQWDKTIGGSGKEVLAAVYEVDSNKYIVAGTSASSISGDKTSDVIGGGTASDYWVLQLEAPVTAKTTAAKMQSTAVIAAGNTLEIMPNPVKDKLLIRYSTTTNSKAYFSVYAANGKRIFETALAPATTLSTHTFNVSHLSGGAYFALLYVNGIKLTKMFTKE